MAGPQDKAWSEGYAAGKRGDPKPFLRTRRARSASPGSRVGRLASKRGTIRKPEKANDQRVGWDSYSSRHPSALSRHPDILPSPQRKLGSLAVTRCRLRAQLG